jgi:hypothetical protein
VVEERRDDTIEKPRSRNHDPGEVEAFYVNWMAMV